MFYVLGSLIFKKKVTKFSSEPRKHKIQNIIWSPSLVYLLLLSKIHMTNFQKKRSTWQWDSMIVLGRANVISLVLIVDYRANFFIFIRPALKSKGQSDVSFSSLWLTCYKRSGRWIFLFWYKRKNKTSWTHHQWPITLPVRHTDVLCHVRRLLSHACCAHDTLFFPILGCIFIQLNLTL
jgi:hypothetical protein